MSRSQPQRKREPVGDREHVMPFGKYKGFTVAALLADDPAYLGWLVRNTDFELDHKLMDELENVYGNAAFEAVMQRGVRTLKDMDFAD